MSVIGNIWATYRGPGRVIGAMLAAGRREDRALAILMAGCALVFVAQWPRLAQKAAESGAALDMLLGGSLFAWLFIMPLVFYLVALLAWAAIRALGGRAEPYGARLALFWALLASTPALFVHTLAEGVLGAGPAQKLAAVLWLGLFLWFWVGGSRAAGWALHEH